MKTNTRKKTDRTTNRIKAREIRNLLRFIIRRSRDKRPTKVGKQFSMRCNLLVLCLMMMLVVAVSSFSSCGGRRGRRCTDSKQCNTKYCRDGVCIKFGDADDDKGQKDPCKPNPCASNETCYRQQVQCVKAPCPPVANCEESNRF